MTRPKLEPTPGDPLDPGLYIVATPIGNLGDITVRGRDILCRAQLVACEDTRVTGKLLKACGADTRMQRYDDHASPDARSRLIERARTEAVVLVSDAGTPLVSDPGYRLVREAREAGVAVFPIPGPCAAIAGLMLAGLPSDRFLFAGFLPVKDKARESVLAELGRIETTLIFYETGPRLIRSLEAMAEAWPAREIAVTRELTKLHEECRTGTAADLAEHYRAHPAKGEIVILAGPPAEQKGESDADSLLAEALTAMSPSKAASQVAKETGLERKALYARALEMKRV